MTETTNPVIDRLGEQHAGWMHPARRTIILESIFLVLIGVAIMHHAQTRSWWAAVSEPGVAGNDSFYHVKMAEMIPEHGILKQFPWLRFCWFTQEGQGFVSNHYGFHVLLAPFVHVSKQLTGSGLAGGRFAMALCFGMNLVLFNLILIQQRVRWRWAWWVVFMLMPAHFFTRHGMVRAIAPSLTFSLAIVLLMFRNRYVWTGIVVLAYTQLYLGGFVNAPILIVLFCVASVAAPRGERSIPWDLIRWSLAAWLLGLVIHPYSSGLLEWLKVQVIDTGFATDRYVGREWKPYENTWWFARAVGITLLVWSVAVCARLRAGPAIGKNALCLLLVHLLFLGLLLKARRFVEYWPVFCVLSAALLASPVLARFDRMWTAWFMPVGRRQIVWIKRAGAAVCVMCILIAVRYTPLWGNVHRELTCRFELNAIGEMMAFLEEDSQPGDVVFTDDWDIFPVFFCANNRNHYVVGLHPPMTSTRRPDLWERFVKITRGQTPADVSVRMPGDEHKTDLHVVLEDIREYFGARYVITDRSHKRLARKLNQAADLAELVYPSASYNETRNAPYRVFRIKP